MADMDPSLLNTLVQGGSFAVLVFLIVYGMFWGIPGALAKHEAVVATLVADGKSREERHERELAKRDATLEKLTNIVDKLADRVDGMEARHLYRPHYRPPHEPGDPA